MNLIEVNVFGGQKPNTKDMDMDMMIGKFIKCRVIDIDEQGHFNISFIFNGIYLTISIDFLINGIIQNETLEKIKEKYLNNFVWLCVEKNLYNLYIYRLFDMAQNPQTQFIGNEKTIGRVLADLGVVQNFTDIYAIYLENFFIEASEKKLKRAEEKQKLEDEEKQKLEDEEKKQKSKTTGQLLIMGNMEDMLSEYDQLFAKFHLQEKQKIQQQTRQLTTNSSYFEEY